MADTIAPLTRQDPEAWEYAILELGKIGKPFLHLVNDLDVDGWHLVNVIAYTGPYVDKLGGIFRRAIDPLPPRAAGSPPGWYTDPSDRHEVRYWNGQAWTHSVATEGVQDRDAPTLLPPTPGLGYH